MNPHSPSGLPTSGGKPTTSGGLALPVPVSAACVHVRAHVSEVAAGGRRTEPLLAKCASPLAATADKDTNTDLVAVSADKQVQTQPTGAAPFVFEEHHRARRSAPSTDKGTTADLKPATANAAIQADIAGPAPKHAPWALATRHRPTPAPEQVRGQALPV